MKQIDYICDICGKPKGDDNHWFAIRTDPPNHFSAVPWTEAVEERSLDIYDTHVCGEKCFHAAASAWLAKQNEPLTNTICAGEALTNDHTSSLSVRV